jgi:hypothetical protein
MVRVWGYGMVCNRRTVLFSFYRYWYWLLDILPFFFSLCYSVRLFFQRGRITDYAWLFLPIHIGCEEHIQIRHSVNVTLYSLDIDFTIDEVIGFSFHNG